MFRVAKSTNCEASNCPVAPLRVIDRVPFHAGCPSCSSSISTLSCTGEVPDWLSVSMRFPGLDCRWLSEENPITCNEEVIVGMVGLMTKFPDATDGVLCGTVFVVTRTVYVPAGSAPV